MGARIDDSDLLARLADHIVATKGATLADALKALEVPHPSHRRIYTKWDRRGLGLVTEAAWRAGEKLGEIAARQQQVELLCAAASGVSAKVAGDFRVWGNEYAVGLPPPLARPSFLSRVKARFWE